MEPEADPQETEPAQPTEDWFEHFAPQLRPPGGRSAAIRARDTIRRFSRYDTSRDDDADVFEAQPEEMDDDDFRYTLEECVRARRLEMFDSAVNPEFL